MTNNFTPSGELVLEQLGINPHNLRADFPNREQRLHYRAVVQWLTDYTLEPEEANIRIGRGCLEAFYHLYQVEGWERARKIIGTPLNTPSNEKSLIQLRPWGYYKFGQYSEALEYLQTALEICRKAGDRYTEVRTLYDLAIFHLLGSRVVALDYWEQALAIAKQMKIPLVKNCQQLKTLFLNEEAHTNLSLGNYIQAIECYQQVLTIAQELQDNREKEQVLINLGKVCCALGDYTKAIAHNQQHLSLVQETLPQMKLAHSSF
jgi:tetratricopeptide (TPR) repeat protein